MGHTTNVYVCSNPNPNQNESCKKRPREECEEQSTPSNTGFNPQNQLRNLPPKHKDKCIQPNQNIEPRDAECIATQAEKDQESEGILEQPTGFPDETLGEKTFEELMNDEDPGPFMGTLDPVLITENDDEEENVESTLPPPPPPSPEPPTPGLQFTPTFTETAQPSGSEMIESSTVISQASPSVTRQDPDGIDWISSTTWEDSTWDGIPFDTTGKTIAEICAFITPVSPRVVRGLRERFYEVNPFADNENPTVSEINNWTIEVIRHFRALLGNGTPVNPDARLYLEARWADERKYTQYWDTKYPTPGSEGTASGQCWLGGVPIDTAGGHCGEAFFPDSIDRATAISQPPYSNNFVDYPELDGYNNRRAQASGLSGANTDLPWSIKFSNVLAFWICSEGLTGHPGPYVGTPGRETFGCSWWHTGGAWTNFRGKWR